MQIKYLPHAFPEQYLRRSTAGAAGYDLRACSYPLPAGNDYFVTHQSFAVHPGKVVAFGTGIAIDMGAGYEETSLCGMVVPRSGLGSRGLVLAKVVMDHAAWEHLLALAGRARRAARLDRR